MTDQQGTWGGARPGAGNPEFKPKWKSGKTMVIRVPEAIADEVLAVARRIDDGEAVTLSNGSEAVESETTNAVRQWCVFARHNDGMLQFMGGYWSKADAQSQAHKHQREHHRQESIGDKPYIGAPPTYEVKEMLVAPVELYAKFDKQAPDLQSKVAELEAKLTVLRNSVEPLKRENERLREQIREYREKLEDKPVTQSSEASLKEEIRRLQAVVNLEKQQKEMCQHKLDKAQQSNKELMNLAREARAELERLQGQPQDSAVTQSSIDSATLFNQLRPLLNRLSDRDRRAIQQKLEEMVE